MNHRRRLLAVIGAGALATTLDAFAQAAGAAPGKIWRLGFLAVGERPTSQHPDVNIDAFLRGMRELGYVEGKNLTLEWRFAQGSYERLPALAVELAQTQPDVLVTYGTAAAKALQAATRSIPIVVAASIDPVGIGLAASLAHPGGNMTGFSALAVELGQKHLDLLRSLLPKLSRVALLVNPGNAAHPELLKSVEGAAKTLNIQVTPVNARTPSDIEPVLASARRGGAQALIVAGDAIFAGLGQQVAAATLKQRLPCISIYRSYVQAGALISYGQNLAEFHRRAASYVDKIFKGAKAGDLPIEQPMILEMLINGKTAKALGLKIPHALLISADKVIE